MIVPIIILNYNSSGDCKKCISNLVEQKGVILDIVIVDNCSSEVERKKLEAILKTLTKDESYQLTYIPNNENRGYNAGNNIGLRYAASKKYKYALIVNPDMEFPQTNYVKLMVDKMEEDDKIVVQGSDIINNEGIHQNPMREVGYWEELLWPFQYLKNYKSKKWYSLDYSSSYVCDKISGCCLMVRMSFVEQIGYFDESVFLYSEESILGAQVKSMNYLMYYNHAPKAIHRHIEKSKGKTKPRMRALFESRWYYLRTYSGYTGIALFFLKVSKKAQKFCTIGV